MSGLWVAVTAEFAGSTFSHRATSTLVSWSEHRVVHPYNLLLDEAGNCVRRGLAGTLPPQAAPLNTSLSEHEKLREIRKILDDGPLHNLAVSIEKIQEVLKR